METLVIADTFALFIKPNHSDDNSTFSLTHHSCHSYLKNKNKHTDTLAHDSDEDARPELLYHHTRKRTKGNNKFTVL